MLLAIDTSSGSSAAVFDDLKLISYAENQDPFGHAENIGNVIRQAIADVGLSAKAITALAIGRGPAPYTGLRVGLAAGIGFAHTLGVPKFGVMTLDAIATSFFETGKFLVTADAKRKQYFARSYEGLSEAGLAIPTSDAMVIEPELLEREFSEFRKLQQPCTAREIGNYAAIATSGGVDLSETSAIYLRSPDVSPSAGKRVSG